jgi:predicted ATP-grasp superfamily ATP-dependent carboligase
MLAQGGAGWLLSCNLQRITRAQDRLHYCGSRVGGAEHRRAAPEPLAAAIAAALPGLWGYVGVDLVDGVDGPMVVDVNPRLTTSYVGLADSLSGNPAGWVLGLRDRDLGVLRRPLAPRAIEVRVPR